MIEARRSGDRLYLREVPDHLRDLSAYDETILPDPPAPGLTINRGPLMGALILIASGFALCAIGALVWQAVFP
jgi:hypothetical protein